MKIGIINEKGSHEKRVALTPDVADKLIQKGFQCVAEKSAGESAFAMDALYEEKGVSLLGSSEEVKKESSIHVRIGAPPSEDKREDWFRGMKEGDIVIGFLDPLGSPEWIRSLAQKKITAFSMELIPRTSRAQRMDALSSQANIGGYLSVLVAANHLPKYLPMLTTAAGTIPPAKVLILGVGVAGLQAIATAKRLGAVVEAFDIRPEVKEQVQSLGATFVEAELEEDAGAEGGYAKEVSEDSKKKTQEALEKHVAAADVVITTAQVPGKKAPELVSDTMLDSMKPGSVVVDLAASQGGNVSASEAGEVIDRKGVCIVGPINLPSQLSFHASQVYSKNVSALCELLLDKESESLNLNFEDDIIAAACVTHDGEIRNEKVKSLL